MPKLSSILIIASTILTSHTLLAQRQLHAIPGSTLAKNIQTAKDAGQVELNTSRFGVTARVPAGFDEAVKESNVVIVKFVNETVAVGQDNLETYFKFQKVRTFATRKKDLDEEQVVKIPAIRPLVIAPPKNTEVIIGHVGGSAIVDGMKVNTPGDLPHLRKGATYLIFLRPAPGLDDYLLLYGIHSIFELRGDTLVPLDASSENLLASDIKNSFSYSLNSIEAYCLKTVSSD